MPEKVKIPLWAWLSRIRYDRWAMRPHSPTRDEPQPEIQEILGKFLADKISEETWLGKKENPE